jgi:hypothetical protein
MINKDIVDQLRDSACGNDCHCHYCERNKIAADTIERLRSFWKQEENTADFLRRDVDVAEQYISRLCSEIETLKKERDEARWEVCELSGNGSIDSATREAISRGWDFNNENGK